MQSASLFPAHVCVHTQTIYLHIAIHHREMRKRPQRVPKAETCIAVAPLSAAVVGSERRPPFAPPPPAREISRDSDIHHLGLAARRACV